jgi:hypothetical protein
MWPQCRIDQVWTALPIFKLNKKKKNNNYIMKTHNSITVMGYVRTAKKKTHCFLTEAHEKFYYVRGGEIKRKIITNTKT